MVGSYDNGFAFITLRDDLEEQLRAVGIDWDIASFVADKQIEFLELLHQNREFAFVFGFDERVR